MQLSNIDSVGTLINSQTKKNTEEIFIKIGNILKKINLEDVDWFGVDGKYAFAKTANRNYPLSISLKELEEKLNGKHFIRIHQSYMVDIRKVDMIKPMENIILIKGENLPIGRSFKKHLLNSITYF